MANPIYSSDIYKNDGAITDAIKELERLNVTIEELNAKNTASAKALLKETQKLTVGTSAQRDAVAENSKQAEEIRRRYEKYTEALSENGVKIAALKNQQRTLNQVNKLEAKLLTEKEGSYNRLSAQYGLNKIRLNQMSQAERETTEAGKNLVKQSADIYEEMKRLQEETGKTALNVGNYEKAIDNALGKLDQMPGSLSAATGGVRAFGAGLKALLANPIVLFIGAIVGVLSALFNAFTKSEKGAQLMAKTTGLMTGLFSQLVDISVKVAESVERAFNDPIGSLKAFGEALLKNVINRFTAFPALLSAIGSAIASIATRDLAGLKKATTEAGEALVQMTTGLDSTQQRDFAAAVKATSDEIVRETNAFIKLETARRNVANSNRSLSKSIENLTTEEQIYQSVADDTTKSFLEREEAAEAARKKTEERAQKEIQLARNNLSIINQELNLRRNNGEQVQGLLDQQLSAYQQLAGAEREYTLSVRDNEKTRAELKQDRLERDLDILIDGFDNQKTINERQIQDDTLTFENRQSLLNRTQELADTTFKKQIETIQQFTGIQVNANELIAESDAVRLNEKIRSLGLSEVIEGRLLEIVRERRTVTQDLAEADKELNEKRVKSSRDELKAKEAALKAERAIELKSFDDSQALRLSEFELIKRTEAEKTRFRLAAEKERLQKILDLNKQFGDKLTDVQIQTIQNQITKIQTEIESVSGDNGETNILDSLGIKLDDEQLEGITTAFDVTKNQLLEFASLRGEIAEQQLGKANQEVASAERVYAAEAAARNAGLQNEAATAKKRLDLAKKTQGKALEEQRKAQQQENALQTIQQTVNLVTATTKIWSQVGNPIIAIPLIALMWGSFIATKIRASQLTKELKHGELEFHDYGGLHGSGNDIPFGQTRDGRQRMIERGEASMVLSRKSTSKYRSTLPQIFQALKAGTFEQQFVRQGDMIQSLPMVSVNPHIQNDNKDLVKEMQGIRKQNETRVYVDGDGNTVEQRGNFKRIYV